MRMQPADARWIGGLSTGSAATGIVPAKVRAPRRAVSRVEEAVAWRSEERA